MQQLPTQIGPPVELFVSLLTPRLPAASQMGYVSSTLHGTQSRGPILATWLHKLNTSTIDVAEWLILNETKATSGLGQSAKYSSRVDVFHLASDNRHAVTAPPLPFRAMNASPLRRVSEESHFSV
jgi:hypothetical protein